MRKFTITIEVPITASDKEAAEMTARYMRTDLASWPCVETSPWLTVRERE